MNTVKTKRFLSMTLAILAAFLFLSPTARADEDAAASTEGGASDAETEMVAVNMTEAGQHLRRTEVVDLGKVPEETATEENCEVLLVADVATGVLIHEKNIAVPMPVGGAAVQLMTVVAALDHLSVEDTITVDAKMMKDMPGGRPKLGLGEKNVVLVADLIVSALYTGSVDAAFVLGREAADRSGTGSIGTLMAEKAAAIGMTDTDYASCDGTGMEQIQSTAADQCELYLEALSNEALLPLMKAGVYKLQSKAAPWITGEDKQAKKDRAAATKANENLPDKLVNGVSAVVPENRLYDVRLSSAVSCTVKSPRKDESARYNLIFIRAVDYRSDMVMVIWTPTSSGTVAVKPLYNLTEIFSRRKIVDLIPYIEVAANALTVEKNGVSVSGWFLGEGHVMYGRQMVSYDPDAKVQNSTNDFDLSRMSVVLKPELSSMVNRDDGSKSIQAKVMVNNSVEGTVTLSTAPRATQTTVSQNTNILYTEDDVMPEEPTLMSQYGWIIIIGGVALLAIIMIIVGVLLRNRMERW